MFKQRKIESSPEWLDADGIKIYTVTRNNTAVDQTPFRQRLENVKNTRNLDWAITPAFALFHEGENFLYLVFAWWGNDNELFTSVSVLTESGWVEDHEKYSFCLYDLEIFWFERNAFVSTMYSGSSCIESYRKKRVKAAL